jgi:hypothetical protein
MELATALEIVRALADGRDPSTGQPLAAGDSCQQPQVVRALYFVVQSLQQLTSVEAPAELGLKNAGKAWTAAEEAQLLKDFEAGLKISELAARHGRTEQAIHGRLYRLGKMPPWPLGVRGVGGWTMYGEGNWVSLGVGSSQQRTTQIHSPV